MIEYIIANPHTVVLFCEAVFVIGFMIFSGVVIWKMHVRSKESEVRLKSSSDDHAKLMASFRRRWDTVESIMDNEDEQVTRKLN